MAALELPHTVLRTLAAADADLGFAELSRSCGEPVAATLSRCLKNLLAEDLVQRHASGRYAAGPALHSLAELLTGGRLERIAEACRQLSAKTGQSALCCSLVSGGHMQRVASSECPGGMAYGPLHEPLPLLAMGFGIPLLSGLGSDDRDACIAEHAAASGDPAAEVQACLHGLHNDGVVLRDERLGSSPLGCTRIVTAIPGQDLSLGITCLGRQEYHAAETLSAHAQQVRQAAERLRSRLGNARSTQGNP